MFPIHILEGLIAFSILFLGRSCLSTESDVACPVGWTSFSSRCYFVMQSLYTWQGARDVCQGLGARVIEITTADENDFMVELVDGVTFTSEDKAWLDCTNIGRSLKDWVCGPDDHELSYTYTNWKPNEPNNAGGEHCMEMYGTGIWNDKSCEAQNLAICEKSSLPKSTRSIYMKRDISWPPRCLQNHVIQTIQSTSLVQCVSRCLATGESCLSLNYLEGTRVCQLNGANDVTAPGDFQETENCKYYRIMV
ncbi:perlucin-like protein isoform X1 [Strongylocentrotus purpuratus]|uniref:Uncharacterized protein n=1 Tax=Strongylocentrotus purpuratus TaxID=7668 RepID=A0A7M7GK27_STRPU|nr:perlucin-like protein isoform X1 [Strongylocentrotus purpuratus]